MSALPENGHSQTSGGRQLCATTGSNYRLHFAEQRAAPLPNFEVRGGAYVAVDNAGILGPRTTQEDLVRGWPCWQRSARAAGLGRVPRPLPFRMSMASLTLPMLE